MGRLSAIPLEPSRFARTLQALDALIADGAAPGAVVGLWESRRSGICRVAARGQRRVVPSPLPLEAETPFDLASLTKILGTALLVARSVERGLVSWRMPIRALLPGFVGEGVRVDQLLSHSAGQPAWRAFHETLRRELGRGPDQGTRGLERVPVGIRQGLLRRLVLSEPLEAHPGERVLYSDLAFLTLGFAMEEAWGLTLDRAIEREVWGALRVPGLRFHRVSRSVSGGRLDEVAATEDCPWRGGVLQGQVHDDNCWAAGGYGGHAGAFGNARSVLELVAGLHGGGFLSHPTLTRMWARSDEPPGCPRTFGWDTPSGAAPSSGTRFSAENTVGHLGFTGTSLWVDLRAGVAVVLLSNRVHPSRANEGFKPWRARVHDALRDDLGY